MSQFDYQVVEIPVDEIHIGVNLTNIRTHFSDERVVELADSIYRDGLMNPLTVMETEDEDQEPITELVAGERRLRAIQYIRNVTDPSFMEEGVPCIQFTGTIHEAQFVNVSENIDREDVDEVDICTWLFARTQDGVTQSELANKLHKSLSWVNFRLLVHERACEEVKKAIREGLISFGAAYELSKNLDEENQKKWILKARTLNKKISVEEAQRAGKPEKTQRPGKTARAKMLAKADTVADDSGGELARGASFALRWVDGLVSEDEMHEAINWEGEK